jgi:hypothetical protein
MPPEILALVAKPHLLFAVVATGVFAGMVAEQFRPKKRRQAWREKKWRLAQILAPRDQVRSNPPDAADQLRIVMDAKFTIQPLLNKSEARVFRELDRIVINCNPAWQVMAQVSLGEILRCDERNAYSCINSKRVDLLLVDSECLPRHVLEYQGGAHYQGTAAARDAVKKEALRQAGIGYHEVIAGVTTPAELRRLLEKLVDRPA